MSAPAPLRVLLLSDGRPGHYRLAEGIVAALARRGPVVVDRLEVRRRPYLPGRGGAALCGLGLGPAAILRLAHGVEATAVPQADVIVSAGAETMPANVAAARLLGAPNIFYGSLRSYRPDWFSLSLTSYAEDARTPHPVFAMKPCPLDPDALPAMPPFSADAPPRLMGLIVGGDGGGVVFADEDWVAVLGLLRTLHRAWGTRWMVSNSRRTPAAVSDRLAAMASETESPLVRLIDVRTAGPGTLSEVFAAVEAVLVTADSSTMLSEAIWARRPVVAVCPARCELPERERTYRAHLEDARHCHALALSEATPALLASRLAAIESLGGNPLDMLAALLAAHLPSVFPDAAPPREASAGGGPICSGVNPQTSR